LPHLVADYTTGKKSAKAAEKTAQAPPAPTTDPACWIPQGRFHTAQEPLPLLFLPTLTFRGRKPPMMPSFPLFLSQVTWRKQ